MTDSLLGAARAWLAQDPDPETRAELEALIAESASGDAAALASLHDRFDERLAFGTAGLRGQLAAGPNRMNRVLVAQAAAGLSAYLLERDPSPTAVIGYDARTNSARFARDTAELLTGAGVRVTLLPEMLPTPVLAYAVRHLGASAGVMVTASHNPPLDNGYKVYLGGEDAGAQIVSPSDEHIAAHIARVARGDIRDLPRGDDYSVADDTMLGAYVAAAAAPAIRALADAPEARTSARELRITYTAMHGVGGKTMARVCDAVGVPHPTIVAAQNEPDPAFPTVAFPNPEEPGALDLALEAARGAGADLILANDPDADRLAVAVSDPGSVGGYRVLTGNETGSLLGWMCAEAAAERGERGTLAASLVSSPALGAVAAAYGHEFVETPTGFKWISRVPNLVFGFEEALGYLVNPDALHDKDGISAAALTIALAARLRARGLTLADRLAEFSERFGSHASGQLALRFPRRDRVDALMERLRSRPPRELAGIAVTSLEDLSRGTASLAPTNALRLWLADGSRVIVRPSGTEPKLKAYVDACSERGSASERSRAAAARVTELIDALRELLDA